MFSELTTSIDWAMERCSSQDPAFSGLRRILTLRSPSDGSSLADFRVPSGEVFVVGDDRLASSDSRTWNGGRGGGADPHGPVDE